MKGAIVTLGHIGGIIFLLLAELQLSISRPGFGGPPYYLHFPPIAYNQLEFNGPGPQYLPPWVQNQFGQNFQNIQNQTNPNTLRNQHLPTPTIGTLRLHLADPTRRGNVIPQVLNNGTAVYYVTGPWGGMKSIVPVNQNIGNTILSTPPYFNIPSVTTPFGDLNRDQQTQSPSPNPNQINNNNNYPWTQQQNFGWGGWSSISDGGPSLTTENLGGSSSPGSMTKEQTSTVKTSTTSTTEGSTTTSTNAPTDGTTTPTGSSSGDTIAKFRRIVSRIREIAIKELRN